MKSGSPLLLIVDMQWDFIASRNADVQKAIINEIHHFIDNCYPIIVLEYMGWGPTQYKIVSAIGRYEKAFYLTKEDDDGSREVCETIKRNGLKVSRFLICGVNTCACVHETAEGLFKLMRQIPIEKLEKGCNCNCSLCRKER